MDDFKKKLEEFALWARQPKNYGWLAPLLLFITILFVVKGCSGKEKKYSSRYVIARDERWYPLYFFGKEKNVLAFSQDLIIEISKRKGLSIQFIGANSGDLLETLDGSADAILSSITPDVILQDRYLFSEPYYDLGAVLLVEEASPITSLDQMQNKYLGIKRGSTALFNIPSYPDLRVFTYDSYIVMLDDILRDKIDGALLNQLNAFNFTSGYYKGRLKVVTPPLTKEGLRLITNTTTRDEILINAFNEGVQELKADGTYSELLNKWDLHDPTRPAAPPPETVK